MLQFAPDKTPLVRIVSQQPGSQSVEHASDMP
jgi:hypothetical protein